MGGCFRAVVRGCDPGGDRRRRLSERDVAIFRSAQTSCSCERWASTAASFVNGSSPLGSFTSDCLVARHGLPGRSPVRRDGGSPEKADELQRGGDARQDVRDGAGEQSQRGDDRDDDHTEHHGVLGHRLAAFVMALGEHIGRGLDQGDSPPREAQGRPPNSASARSARRAIPRRGASGPTPRATLRRVGALASHHLGPSKTAWLSHAPGTIRTCVVAIVVAVALIALAGTISTVLGSVAARL